MATTGTALYPGSTTFPGSTTYPGGGPRPQVEVLYSTSDAATDPPLWLHVPVGKLRGYSCSHGRETELDEFDAGTATIALDNRTRLWDPTFDSNIRPGNRWWIRTKHGGVTEDRFKGYADRYALSWPEHGKDSAVEVSCTDETKILNLGKLPRTNPPRDSYGDVVVYDTPRAYWPLTDYSGALVAQALVGENNLDWVGGGGSVANTTGPIYGARGETALQIAGNGEFFEGAEEGDSADMQGLTEMTVEAWLMTTNTGGGMAVLGPESTSTSIPVFQMGLTFFSIVNSGGTQIDANASTPLTGIWYHMVGTISGGFIRLYRNGEQVAATAMAGVLDTPAGGSSWGLTNTTGTASFSQLAMYRGPLAFDRVGAHYEAGRERGFYNQTTSDRFDSVLEAAGSKANRTKTGSTNYDMQGVYMHGQPPLDELRRIAQVEAPDGMLFVGRSGQIVFYFASGRPSSVSATFDDDGSDLRYKDAEQELSESFLYNIWNVTREGGLTQTVSDGTSISRHFERPQSVSNDVATDAEALEIATAYLAKYKDPLSRVPTVTPDMANTDTAVAALARELGDKIRVIRRPLGGGSAIDQQSWIQKISESCGPDRVIKLTFNVSPV